MSTRVRFPVTVSPTLSSEKTTLKLHELDSKLQYNASTSTRMAAEHETLALLAEAYVELSSGRSTSSGAGLCEPDDPVP